MCESLHAVVHVQRSEDNFWDLVFSSYHTGPKGLNPDTNQVLFISDSSHKPQELLQKKTSAQGFTLIRDGMQILFTRQIYTIIRRRTGQRKESQKYHRVDGSL